MTKLLILSSLAAILVSAQSPNISDEFVGVWNLISYQQKNAGGGITYPMGDKPVGQLTYDARGRMSAQIMHPDRPNFRSARLAAGSAEEKVAAFDGYLAYYGTYEVKEKEGTVIHHVLASLYPNLVGSDQRRLFQFSEGKLILRSIDGFRGGPGTESRLVWERSR